MSSCWSRFYVNIITGSRVMKISFYKGLTRNLEIGNTFVWAFPNIWRLRRLRNTKFSKKVFTKMLLNATKCQGYSFYCFWVIKRKRRGWGEGVTPPTTQPPRLELNYCFHANTFPAPNCFYLNLSSCYTHKKNPLHDLFRKKSWWKNKLRMPWCHIASLREKDIKSSENVLNGVNRKFNYTVCRWLRYRLQI